MTRFAYPLCHLSRCKSVESPPFRITPEAYAGRADPWEGQKIYTLVQFMAQSQFMFPLQLPFLPLILFLSPTRMFLQNPPRFSQEEG